MGVIEETDLRKKNGLPMRAREVYIEAIRQWGPESQLNIVIEECGELIHAVQKIRREKNDRRVESLASEIADMRIMLDQLEMIMQVHYDIETFAHKVDRHMHEKLSRLRQMLQGKIEQTTLHEVVR